VLGDIELATITVPTVFWLKGEGTARSVPNVYDKIRMSVKPSMIRLLAGCSQGSWDEDDGYNCYIGLGGLGGVDSPSGIRVGFVGGGCEHL
jgi:hypothetical protein